VMDRNSRPMTAVLVLMTMGVQQMPKTIIEAAASTRNLRTKAFGTGEMSDGGFPRPDETGR
jgi:hypothetical protein